MVVLGQSQGLIVIMPNYKDEQEVSLTSVIFFFGCLVLFVLIFMLMFSVGVPTVSTKSTHLVPIMQKMSHIW